MNGYHEWGAELGNFHTNAYLGSLVRLGYCERRGQSGMIRAV